MLYAYKYFYTFLQKLLVIAINPMQSIVAPTEGNVIDIMYNTCQKFWDTLHTSSLDKTFVPLLLLNSVGFWEKYMG